MLCMPPAVSAGSAYAAALRALLGKLLAGPRSLLGAHELSHARCESLQQDAQAVWGLGFVVGRDAKVAGGPWEGAVAVEWLLGCARQQGR